MSHWVKCDFDGCEQMLRFGEPGDHSMWLRVFRPEATEELDHPMEFCGIDHLAGWALREIATKDSLK